MTHKKIDNEVGTEYFCDNVLIRKDCAHTNLSCQECPVCGQPFRTYGTIWSRTSMVEEGVWN